MFRDIFPRFGLLRKTHLQIRTRLGCFGFINTPLVKHVYERPHPYVVIRSPPRCYNISVYYRFTCLYPDASGRYDVRLYRMMYSGQSFPFDSQRCQGFGKNLRAVTDECHWLVGLQKMADDVEATLIDPQMLRAPTSGYGESGER